MERDPASGMNRVTNESNANRGVALQSLKSVTGATRSARRPTRAVTPVSHIFSSVLYERGIVEKKMRAEVVDPVGQKANWSQNRLEKSG